MESLLAINHNDRNPIADVQYERSPQRLCELLEQHACQSIPEQGGRLTDADDLAQSVFLFARDNNLFQFKISSALKSLLTRYSDLPRGVVTAWWNRMDLPPSGSAVEKENCPPTHTENAPATPRRTRTRTASAPRRRIEVGAFPSLLRSPKTPKGAPMSKASLSKDPQPITPSCPEDRQHSSPPKTKPSFLPSSPARQSSVLSCKPKPTTPSVVAQPPHTLTPPQVSFPAAKRIRDSPPVTPLLSHPPSKRHKVYFQEYFANPRGSSNENVLSKLPEDVASSTNDNTAKQPTVEDIVFSEVISNKSTPQRQGSSVSPSMPTKEKITHAVSTNTDSDGLGKPLEHTRKAADVMIAAKRRFLYTRMNIFDITTDWEPSPPRTGRVEREEGEGAIEYLARRGLL